MEALELITWGRPSGWLHRVERWFVYWEGAVYPMAHAQAVDPGTDWYQNLRADRRVIVEIEGRQWPGIAEPLPPEDLPRITERRRPKYGDQTVRTWYEGTPRRPVRIRLLGEGWSGEDAS
ncbi:MAG: nitroreductase family deazaflavin-dependent oxidoreductase [Thermoflexus sp.]|nr:nitroreductase family deazaflavin-dependent oxidoreductase [Thermoflexus sp.]